MLTDLDIKHRRELNMVGPGTLTPLVYPLDFLGSPEYPWQLKNISGTLISGPAINIVGCEVRDENSNLIYNASLLPWTLANTVSNVNTNQSPDVPFVSFFSIVIVGMPSDLYVYSDWTLTVVLLNPVAGSGYNITASFMQGFFRDKYRLSA